MTRSEEKIEEIFRESNMIVFHKSELLTWDEDYLPVRLWALYYDPVPQRY